MKWKCTMGNCFSQSQSDNEDILDDSNFVHSLRGYPVAALSSASPKLESWRKKKLRKVKKTLRHQELYGGKQQLSLYLPQGDTIDVLTCDKHQIFKLSGEPTESWWLVSTKNPHTGELISGYSSRYSFFPVPSNSVEDTFPWFLGNISREESEALLQNSANPHGAFLFRYSSNNSQFVLSVKQFREEKSRYIIVHFNVNTWKNKETGKVKYYLEEDKKFTNLEKLVCYYLHDSEEHVSFQLTSVCLIPNPTSDPAFLRRWELDLDLDAWQVPRTELELGEELGHGNFGAVNSGLWRGEIPVAVKTLKYKVTNGKNYEKEKAIFLKETEIMKSLNHPNVVKMFGVCIERTPFFLIQERCENGDLLHHLRKYGFLKHPHSAEEKERHENIPTFHTLLVWCLQIDKGMIYLESMKLVHRDLAARNVLLDRCFVAKVADFSLSMEEEQEEEEGAKQAIATYWSSPEAIEHREFSHKSDVWSYGVTVWEILSLVDRPYNGIPKDQLREKLREGPFLMDPPRNYLRTPDPVMDLVYSLLKDCWERAPHSRPGFATIQPRLEKIMALNLKRKKRKKKQSAWSETKPGAEVGVDEDGFQDSNSNYETSIATTVDYRC